MPNTWASGKHAIAECDICGFRYKLHDLRMVFWKTKPTNWLACPECWDPDHPQLQLGMYPVDDPQALENPRPDYAGYYSTNQVSGAGGSRMTNWGFNPVGGARGFDSYLTYNPLVGKSSVGTVKATGT